jgi:hypothetical protein
MYNNLGSDPLDSEFRILDYTLCIACSNEIKKFERLYQGTKSIYSNHYYEHGQ